METFDQKIVRKGNLLVVHDDMSYLSTHDKIAFAMARRQGFGASDSSTLLNVNPYETLEGLIAQKRAKEVTAEELKIGELPNVRKGVDLEPLILNKAQEFLKLPILEKPSAMFRLKDCPVLTVNFDGVAVIGDTMFPVEAKYVSTFGGKYWNTGYAIKQNLAEGGPKICGGAGVKDHIVESAALYGIPAYYYTQMQHQLLALDAEFGVLVGLFDKDWNIYCYKIYADKFTQNALKNVAVDAWGEVLK